MSPKIPAKVYKAFSKIKLIIFIIIFSTLLGIGYLAYITYFTKSEISISSKVAGENTSKEIENDFNGFIISEGEDSDYVGITQISDSPTNINKPFSILILGIDKYKNSLGAQRTDSIHLITLSTDRNKIAVTHIPRDIWVENTNSKINAIFHTKGIEALKSSIYDITGQYPDRYVSMDFDDFIWLIDSVGGLEIDVPNPFIDEQFKDTESEDTSEVYFEMGRQKMDGRKALTYARSRYGNNDESGDFARGRRQHIIMKAFVNNFFAEDRNHLFKPINAKSIYQIISSKIKTDISLEDAEILLELASEFDLIDTNFISLSTDNYLEVPISRDKYLGAWVLIGKNNNFKPIHTEILKTINLGYTTESFGIE